MNEEPYPPLRPQPPLRRRSGPNTTALVSGIIVLTVLAALLLFLVLTRQPGGSASASATPSPSASAAASPSATAADSPDGSPAGTAEPGAAPPDLAHDTIVTTLVDGLSVRAEPALGGELLGTLALGAPSFVVDGPTASDGYAWFLVSGLGLPANTGCTGPAETEPFSCPVWWGWAAAASETGDPWLQPTGADDCPDEPLTAESLSIGVTAIMRLACFGSEPITFRGWYPEVPDDAGLGGACASQDEPSGWLLCQNINYDFVLADEDQDFFGIGVRVSTDPAGSASMPERGTWVEVTAHLDDPAAEGCDEAAHAAGEPDRPDEQIVLDCRAELVLDAAEAVDGP